MGNVEKLRAKYPDYFKNKVNFNAVLHNKNSVSEIHTFFKNTFDKVPAIGELSTSGITPSKKEEYLQTYTNVNQSLFAAEDYNTIVANMFINLPNIQSVGIFAYNKTMIRETRPEREELLAKQVINPNYFGKIVVSSKGDIYANVNPPPIGKLGKETLYNVVYKELYSGRSWRRLRTQVKPCRNCIYEGLCPPLSNYETVLKRNNMCTVM
ncbi:MAG: hypothetical protein GY757_34920 [bacterium]|nr:hypothetical protein [bacterium]